MSAAPAPLLTLADPDTLERWRRLPYARYGVCTGCERTHDADGSPIWLRGRQRTRLVCLWCFNDWPLRRQLGS